MGTITIICSVAAEFRSADGSMKYTVDAKKRNLVISDAPAWIVDTLMFKGLAADGSLKYVTPANKIQVENEPTIGLAADGKAIDLERPEVETAKVEPEEKPVETAEEKPAEAVEEAPKKRAGRKPKNAPDAE